jgi:CBS domain containing-hemolysin-like protein
VQGSIGAVAGWAVSHIFHYISPAMGALFGFTMGVSHTIAAALLDRLLGSSVIERVTKFILTFAISTTIALGVLTLVGYSISIETGLLLALATVPVRSVINYIFIAIVAGTKFMLLFRPGQIIASTLTVSLGFSE